MSELCAEAPLAHLANDAKIATPKAATPKKAASAKKAGKVGGARRHKPHHSIKPGVRRIVESIKKDIRISAPAMATLKQMAKSFECKVADNALSLVNNSKYKTISEDTICLAIKMVLPKSHGGLKKLPAGTTKVGKAL